MPVCLHCSAHLVWQDGRGFQHPGGGLYVVECCRCGWQSDRAEDQRKVHCPKCSGELRDHHVALPVMED